MINDQRYLGHQECLNDQKIEILMQLSANITRHHGVHCERNLKKDNMLLDFLKLKIFNAILMGDFTI